MGSSLDRWLEQHSTFAILVGLMAVAVSYLVERHAPSSPGRGFSYLWAFLLSAGVVFALAGLRMKVTALRSRRRSA